MPPAGTLSRLFIHTTDSQPANGALTVTVRRNGVDTAVTVTIAGGAAAGIYTDVSNSVHFNQGDLLSLAFANGSPDTSAATVRSVALQYSLSQQANG